MNNKMERGNTNKRSTLSQTVGAKAARKLKSRCTSISSIWLGLGLMGVIGWSVAIPTLLGVALGIWIDNHYPGRHSWTLMLLVIGLGIGCFTAWHKMVKEDKEIRNTQGKKNE
jgi:ATP synthase protein I